MDYMFNVLSNDHKGEHLVREWAVGRWEEGEQVSLAEELPAIHARNRAERERQAAGGEEDEH
jgi:G2/mitotic-specific cyclin 1/2